MQAWYLVYTKPQAEDVALENLSRQGFEAYLPKARMRRRRSGRVRMRIEPMFPRYLFIRLNDETDDWGPIRSTIGVAKLVRFGSLAARVPTEFIESLKERADGDGYQPLDGATLREGDRVRIEEGAFRGYEAIFQADTGKSRVLLLLEIAGKMARIQLPSEQIDPL